MLYHDVLKQLAMTQMIEHKDNVRVKHAPSTTIVGVAGKIVIVQDSSLLENNHCYYSFVHMPNSEYLTHVSNNRVLYNAILEALAFKYLNENEKEIFIKSFSFDLKLKDIYDKVTACPITYKDNELVSALEDIAVVKNTNPNSNNFNHYLPMLFCSKTQEWEFPSDCIPEPNMDKALLKALGHKRFSKDNEAYNWSKMIFRIFNL